MINEIDQIAAQLNKEYSEDTQNSLSGVASDVKKLSEQLIQQNKGNYDANYFNALIEQVVQMPEAGQLSGQDIVESMGLAFSPEEIEMYDSVTPKERLGILQYVAANDGNVNIQDYFQEETMDAVMPVQEY